MRTVFEPMFALVAKACPFFDTVDAASMDLLAAGSRRTLFDRGCIVFSTATRATQRSGDRYKSGEVDRVGMIGSWSVSGCV